MKRSNGIELFKFSIAKVLKEYQCFFKENVRNPVWICRGPISLILGTRFEILGTRIGSLKRLKKTLRVWKMSFKKSVRTPSDSWICRCLGLNRTQVLQVKNCNR